MTRPQIKIDWTINVTSLFSVLLFIGGIFTGWYNLKQEVAVNKATSDVKFSQIDASIVEVKAEIIRTTSEVKGEIKDLRVDLKK